MKTLNITTHFEERIDERFEFITELEGLSYEALALPALTATKRGVLPNGDTFYVVTLNNITYGLGYKMNGNEVVITTALTPFMIDQNYEWGTINAI